MDWKGFLVFLTLIGVAGGAMVAARATSGPVSGLCWLLFAAAGGAAVGVLVRRSARANRLD